MIKFLQRKRLGLGKARQQGSVLILSLATAAALLILAGSYATMIPTQQRIISRYTNSLLALNLAEAGAEEALWELNYSEGNFLGTEGWVWDDVAKTQTKTVPSFQTAAGDVIGDYVVVYFAGANPTITATGFVPSSTAPGMVNRTVTINLSFTSPLFTAATFGMERVVLMSNVLVGGDVGTNAISTSPAAIELLSNVSVKGDAIIGPGGDPAQAISQDASSVIQGTSRAAASARTLPEITGPTGLDPKGSISLGGLASETIDGSGEYDSITLTAISKLTITNDATLYIKGDLKITSNSALIIENDAKVEIYVDGGIEVMSNVGIYNLSNDPTRLAIYATDELTDEIKFSANVLFYGTLYSRNADISLLSNVKMKGAVLGKRVNLVSNVSIEYDQGLIGPGAPMEISSTPRITSWQEG